MRRSRLVVAGPLCLAALAVAGCGGGLGGGGQSTRLSGYVTANQTKAAKLSRAASGSAVAGSVVNAYIWPDLAKSVARATADSQGWYSLALPSGSSGKDIVLIAEQGAGASKLRMSLIVPDVPTWGKTVANIDEASTIAAEVVASAVSAKGGNIDDVAGSAVETIAAAVRTAGGYDASCVVAGGTFLPDTFGAGLKNCAEKTTFVDNDATVQRSIATIAQETAPDIKRARRMAQMLRDTGRDTLAVAGTGLQNIVSDVGAQLTTLEDAVTPAVPFFRRTLFAYVRMGMPVPPDNTDVLTLVGQVPGIYAMRGTPGNYSLVRTGDSADGKSWTLSVEVDDHGNNYRNDVFTITPTVALSTFALDPRAQAMQLRIHNVVDTSIDYQATLTAQTLSGGNVSANLAATYSSSALASPIHFQGTLLGVPPAVSKAVGTVGVPATFARVTVNGSISGPNFGGTLQSLVFEWNTNWFDFDNIKAVSLSNVHATFGSPAIATVDASDALVEFYPSPTTPAQDVPDLKHLHFNGSVRLAGHTLTGRDLDLVLARQAVEPNSRAKPKGRATDLGSLPPITSISGGITYVGPTLTLSGSATGSWSNPANASLSGAVADFPNLQLHIAGTMTPAHGFTTSLDATLVSSNTAANPTVTLTLAKLGYGPETLSGSMQAVFDVSGGAVQGNPTVSATLTLQPENLAMTLAGRSNAITGALTYGGATEAVIGYSDIGASSVPSIGHQLVIKYNDGTFETAASVLPDLNIVSQLMQKG